MSYLITPEGYKPLLDLKQTELGIKQIKEFFQLNLSSELRLRRVTAPLFVLKGMGINDDLNGVERPVTFPIKDLADAQAEVVHSLAKWKRVTLADYHIEPGYGIYTDMNAIRADEELGNLHSLYVDQWDWERVILPEERTLDFLRATVERIYAALRRTEFLVCERFPQISPFLPETVHFIHAEELRQRYPDLTPKEREDRITREFGAVFIIGIGCPLGDGKPHDLRAPDYDDYSTIASNGLPGLNGDLLIWYPRSSRPSTSRIGQGRKAEPLLSPTTHGGHAAAQRRRRHRPVAPLHDIPAQSTHRRDTSEHLARRDAQRMRATAHPADLIRHKEQRNGQTFARAHPSQKDTAPDRKQKSGVRGYLFPTATQT